MEMMPLQPVFPSEERTITPLDFGPDLNDPYAGSHWYSMQNCNGFSNGSTEYVDSTQTIKFVEKHEDGTMTPGLQSEQLLIALIDRHKKLNGKFPSREGSLAITKMEEALFWLEARVKERMYRGVMGDLKK